MYIYISYIKCIATTGAIIQLPTLERCGEAAAGGGSTCLTLQVLPLTTPNPPCRKAFRGVFISQFPDMLWETPAFYIQKLTKTCPLGRLRVR